jgi:hypothetical protein
MATATAQAIDSDRERRAAELEDQATTLRRPKSAPGRPRTAATTPAAADGQSAGDPATAAPSAPTPNGRMRPDRTAGDAIEQEIRLAIDAALYRKPLVGLSVADQFSDAFSGLAGVLDQVWDVDELRGSEHQDLDEAGGDRIGQERDVAMAAAIEALVDVALGFATRHPDAPRRPAMLHVADPIETLRTMVSTVLGEALDARLGPR